MCSKTAELDSRPMNSFTVCHFFFVCKSKIRLKLLQCKTRQRSASNVLLQYVKTQVSCKQEAFGWRSVGICSFPVLQISVCVSVSVCAVYEVRNVTSFHPSSPLDENSSILNGKKFLMLTSFKHAEWCSALKRSTHWFFRLARLVWNSNIS